MVNALLELGLVSSMLAPVGINYKSEYLERPAVSTCSTGSFYEIGHSSSIQKILECEDGYVLYYLTEYKADGNGNSNLYLVKVDSQFIPGYVARENGYKRSDGSNFTDHSLHSGYVHMNLEQYSEKRSDGQITKLGGVISPIANWPTSSSFKTTYTSKSSTSFEVSDNYEFGEGGEIKQTIGSTFTFSYDYKRSTLSSDPVVSAQSGTNPLDNSWSFKVSDYAKTGRITFHISTFVLFEMEKPADHSVYENAFYVNLEFKFTGAHKNFGWWECFDAFGSVKVK